ncbi:MULTISPECIES: hypothetical protein [Olivibacter]|jgi:hypothetical protein|uniref:Uncharacterized protein n=2 Tax=Olivibacter TaxID=376469 RepID=A0ABV6HQM2_9SPHI|nr:MULTISPECIES: hypothetical protein [Olivibacter]MDX3917449.1 hypothetical protein [Pseudosphingobacterium sp.]QEL03952.1 hypothetical protein FKG96_25000 [Olivibacter sp. LS-1]
MKKIILRITLAAGLVGVANWVMNDDNKVNAAEVSVTPMTKVQEVYRITDESHPNFGLEGDLATVQALCPSSGQECAQEVGNPNNIEEWNGGATKF